MSVDSGGWIATLGWSMIAVVLFVVGMLFGEEIFALFSLVAVGLAAASAVKAYRSRLQPSKPTSLLEEQDVRHEGLDGLAGKHPSSGVFP